MNVTDFTTLLQHPVQVSTQAQTNELEEVLESYPYFQAARALYLRGLKNLNSYKYNQALKYTAACTADREVLFDLITSQEFRQDKIAETLSGKKDLLEQETVSEEVIPNPERDTGMIEKDPDSPLPRSSSEAEQILNPRLFRSKDPEIDKSLKASEKEARETLQIGSPLQFTRNERHSFSEWLQITNLQKPVGQTDPEETGAPQQKNKDSSLAQKRSKKFARIDEFISRNPKIIPGEREAAKVNIKDSLKLDSKELMTETLARVYLEQGKYKNAIQAYRILSLKYPEKSSFFADQIKAVENLREKNSDKKQ